MKTSPQKKKFLQVSHLKYGNNSKKKKKFITKPIEFISPNIINVTPGSIEEINSTVRLPRFSAKFGKINPPKRDPRKNINPQSPT